MKYQVMPDLTPIEYEALKADIAEKGVLIPVEMDESGELLDGHHRRRAWEELKADGVSLPDYPRIIRTGMTEQEKRNHARRLNVLRRQLTKEQRDEQMRAMRADGMTYQKIADTVGEKKSTVHRLTRDVELSHLGKLPGADGKYRPATYAKQKTVEDGPGLWDEDDDGEGDKDELCYTSGQSAYCKYCYTYQTEWDFGDEYGVWECPNCQHGILDSFMQIGEPDEDDEDDEECEQPTSSARATIFVADDKEHGKVKDALSKMDAPVSGNFTPSGIHREARRQMQERRLADPPPVPAGTYRVIYADPPWQYGNVMPDYATEQADHYTLLTVAEVAALPVKEMAQDNAVLFLWVTSPILEESFQVINAWGFKYKSSFIWDKVKHNMGHYNSVRHEILLICTRGSCQPDVHKLFDSVQSIERTAHSVKPDEFREIIDAIYPHGERVELFARRSVDGWARWGNE